ncbi:uncharacterized protein AB675_3012 [Cyphellophora attinorum]|uniref:Uncharacterized protein n=1 Tax=Cyphellophora attinorum TaxID=1664694 RepID=A0A0N1NZ13_9EURO|nr:uncharacterized protein AB675_3012 [Phialophora attinorum]KPI37907.1 hypothetical protein AB675_3012 [Phialophora attinorum]
MATPERTTLDTTAIDTIEVNSRSLAHRTSFARFARAFRDLRTVAPDLHISVNIQQRAMSELNDAAFRGASWFRLRRLTSLGSGSGQKLIRNARDNADFKELMNDTIQLQTAFREERNAATEEASSTTGTDRSSAMEIEEDNLGETSEYQSITDGKGQEVHSSRDSGVRGGSLARRTVVPDNTDLPQQLVPLETSAMDQIVSIIGRLSVSTVPQTNRAPSACFVAEFEKLRSLAFYSGLSEDVRGRARKELRYFVARDYEWEAYSEARDVIVFKAFLNNTYHMAVATIKEERVKHDVTSTVPMTPNVILMEFAIAMEFCVSISDVEERSLLMSPGMFSDRPHYKVVEELYSAEEWAGVNAPPTFTNLVDDESTYGMSE